VATAIRSDSLLQDLPVIMLTSVDQTEDGQNFSALGIQGHLVKPARSSLLLETIIRVLHEACDESSETREGVAMVRAIGNRQVRQERLQGQEHKQEKNQEQSQEKAASTKQDTPAIAPRKTLEEDAINAKAASATLDRLGDNSAKENITPENGTQDDGTRRINRESIEASNSQEIDVLIAEDNEVNQIVFRQILESTGYSFLMANNGHEAVQLYQKHRPKVICMDVSMPVMNGHEATIEIRAQEAQSGIHTPIIGVTAHAIKGDMEKCFDAGMDDYLSKPVSPDKLEDKINKWMKQAEQKTA
jgi:CheY-like chemotaxis protein